MQPLGTKKKSRNLLGQKKSHNLLGQNKITQPLDTKKTGNLLGQKKSQNLSGQKNDARSQRRRKKHATCL